MIPYQRGQLETFRCCLTSPKDATDKYEAHSDSNTAEVAQQFSRKNTPQPGRLAPQAGQTALPSNTASHQPCKHVFLLERGPMGQTKAPPYAHCNASALHACLCLASPRGPSWGTLRTPLAGAAQHVCSVSMQGPTCWRVPSAAANSSASTMLSTAPTVSSVLRPAGPTAPCSGTFCRRSALALSSCRPAGFRSGFAAGVGALG